MKPRKLVLSRETLVNLGHEAMENAHGGVSVGKICVISHVSACCPVSLVYICYVTIKKTCIPAICISVVTTSFPTSIPTSVQASAPTSIETSI